MAFVKKKPFRSWRQLKRSKSLKSCPILVWETRSSAARSASIAASTAIVCDLGFGKEWSTQQHWLSLLQATAFSVFALFPPCISVTKQSCNLSVHLLSTGSPVPNKVNPAQKQLCLRRRRCDWRQNTIKTNKIFKYLMRKNDTNTDVLTVDSLVFCFFTGFFLWMFIKALQRWLKVTPVLHMVEETALQWSCDR